MLDSCVEMFVNAEMVKSLDTPEQSLFLSIAHESL